MTRPITDADDGGAAAAAAGATAASTAAASTTAAAAAATGEALVASASRVHHLPDGRKLSYVDCGDASSSDVVLFFHPVQGNRHMALIFHEAAQKLRLRVIAPDRPGYGGSCPLPSPAQRTVGGHVADVLAVLRALGVDKVAVLGSSAGSMYALAMTLHPEASALVAGRPTLLPPWVPPSSLPEGAAPPFVLRLLSAAPRALATLAVGAGNWFAARPLARGAKVADIMSKSAAHEVAAFASDPANDAYYRAMIAEWRTAGIYDEMLLCAEAGGGGGGGYGGAAASSNNSNSNSGGKGSSGGGDGSKGVLRERFSYLTDVKAPVRVYAAANDVLVPAAVAQGWAAALPAGAVELRVIEGATHDGIVHTHKGKVLEVLARDLRGGRRG